MQVKKSGIEYSLIIRGRPDHVFVHTVDLRVTPNPNRPVHVFVHTLQIAAEVPLHCSALVLYELNAPYGPHHRTFRGSFARGR